ncbi:GNAT family N-acetyltransferase [Nocardioides dongkuii]|uniref:GNAT family N-acetyltransferase n=1 Tax=Nocardioides dongkuii TaxID=2760089 RepID=UPI0015FC9D9F|nr:GNAT family N-acetyltransferase [Nocardioides dongkuii]
MTQQLHDNTGAPVTVRLERVLPIGTYAVRLADGSSVGRADFVDSPEVEGERILFHTEVAPEVGGRGLAGLLVREVLADSLRTGTTVVPVCPLFAAHLKEHGDEYVADGGRFRKPRPADLALVTSMALKGPRALTDS